MQRIILTLWILLTRDKMWIWLLFELNFSWMRIESSRHSPLKTREIFGLKVFRDFWTEKSPREEPFTAKITRNDQNRSKYHSSEYILNNRLLTYCYPDELQNCLSPNYLLHGRILPYLPIVCWRKVGLDLEHNRHFELLLGALNIRIHD